MWIFSKSPARSAETNEGSSLCQFCGAAVESGPDSCLLLLAQLAERARAEKIYAQAHLFSVDAHALQHPELHGQLSSRVHLLSLCLTLERGASASIESRKPPVEKFLTLGRDWPSLDAPPAGRRGTLTVRNVLAASPSERPFRARQWAEDVWQAWQPHHPWVRRMLDRLSHD